MERKRCFVISGTDAYTSPNAILDNEMTNRSNLPKVEQLLGYTFLDKHLGTAALRTDRLGFSRLEYLGDAIMGLSVYTVAMCDGPIPACWDTGTGGDNSCGK